MWRGRAINWRRGCALSQDGSARNVESFEPDELFNQVLMRAHQSAGPEIRLRSASEARGLKLSGG